MGSPAPSITYGKMKDTDGVKHWLSQGLYRGVLFTLDVFKTRAAVTGRWFIMGMNGDVHQTTRDWPIGTSYAEVLRKVNSGAMQSIDWRRAKPTFKPPMVTDEYAVAWYTQVQDKALGREPQPAEAEGA